MYVKHGIRKKRRAAGLCRTVPNCVELCRTLPGCAGLCRNVSGCAGVYRSVPKCAGLLWTVPFSIRLCCQVRTPYAGHFTISYPHIQPVLQNSLSRTLVSAATTLSRCNVLRLCWGDRNTVSSSDCTASVIEWLMNNELKKMWKEAIVA
jgi:hypothetical protein